MSRRSQRIQAKDAADADLVSGQSGSRPEIRPVEKASGAKVVCTAAPARKGRIVQRKRGSLKSMLKMPLDILIEIMVYLSPKDLLALARTTKDLRTFLMKRSSATFWKAARLNVEDLPACPEDLSEPAYANLLFDPHCHSCLRRHCDNIYWEYRVRLCKQCYEKLAIDFPYEFDELVSTKEVRDKLGSISGSDVFPEFSCPLAYSRSDLCYAPYIEKFKQACPPEDALDELADYIQAAKDRLTKIMKTIRLFQSWEQRFNHANSIRLRNLRCERKEAILAKLVALGYQPELSFMHDLQLEEFENMVEVRKACALSSQSWKNSEPRILAVMNDIRKQRLERMRIDDIMRKLGIVEDLLPQSCPRFYQQSLSSYEVVLSIPEVRKIVELPEFDQTRLENTLKTLVPPYAEKRLQNARLYFEKLVRKDINLDPSTDPLSLAVAAYFECKKHHWCRKKRSWADMPHHECYQTEPDKKDSEYARAARQVFDNHSVWKMKPSGFSSLAQDLEHYILLYGLDPKTATAEDMDKSDARLVCPEHGSCEDFVTIHSWRSAILTEYACTGCELVRAPRDQAAAAIQLDGMRLEARIKAEQSLEVWICARCPRRNAKRSSKAAVAEHLRTFHHVTVPEEEDQVFRDWYARRPVSETSVRLIPSELEGTYRAPYVREIKDHRAMFFKFK